METDDENVYASAFSKATEEFEELKAEYTAITQKAQQLSSRMAVVKQIIDGLATVLELQEPPSAELNQGPGISEVIEAFLKDNQKFYYTPVTVRKKLESQGVNLSKYKNALAVIHTTMKRLAANPKCGVYTYEKDGETRYTWQDPPQKEALENLKKGKSAK